MKIAIIGTRGIPNHYGGFEQFAEYLSIGLIKKGHNVSVYNSHNHPYQKKIWKGVEIIHQYDPEHKFGTVGQFIYDLNCILDSRKRKYDIILQLGYTSNSIWGKLLPKQSVIVTNMDGLEWKRSKYSKSVRKFLKYAEKLAIKTSDYFISDSIGIKKYLIEKYNIKSEFIAYGASAFKNPEDTKVKEKFPFLKPFNYDMLIARMEPENSIETILSAKRKSSNKNELILVGNTENKFGKYLKQEFKSDSRIKFLGSIYDHELLNNLRYFSNLYFHGHSVGGTNPSLLEAMASGALICAHNNVFNKAILDNDGLFFSEEEELTIHFDSVNKKDYKNEIENNLYKIKTKYSWPMIINNYEKFLRHTFNNSKK